jgi:hypothetical protein
MGVALGNIMATIIPAHMRKSGSKELADQSASVVPPIGRPRHLQTPLSVMPCAS